MLTYYDRIIETHHKTSVVLGCFAITIAGWFAWQGFLNGAYAAQPSPYAVRGSFAHTFGPDLLWWVTLVIVLVVLVVLETSYRTVKHRLVVAGLWGVDVLRARGRRCRGADDAGGGDDNVEDWQIELWQELEKDPAVRARLRQMLEDEERGIAGDNNDGPDTIEEEESVGAAVERRDFFGSSVEGGMR